MERDRQLNVRLSTAEFDRLESVAQAYEMSVSATIRLLIRRESALVGGNQQYELTVLPGHINLPAAPGGLLGNKRKPEERQK